MLQNIRDRLSGPFVWAIIGIIVVPFAFWGIETMRVGGGDPAVVKVDGQKITESQLRRGTEQRIQQLQQLMGDKFRQDLIDTKRFRQAVLDDMTQELVLRRHAEQGGYRASDAALFDAIAAVPAFQENGKFSTEAYRARLAQMGYSVQRFESQLRDSLVIDQMREGVLDSGFVTDKAAGEAFRLEQQQRDLTYLLFDAARYLTRVKVSDEDIQKRYEAQKKRYQAPERIQLDYLELALAELPDAPAPGAEVLKAIYDSDKAARFSTAEERHARHILINFGADKAAARKRIDGLAEMIAKGSDFASLAGSQSDDPGSKGKGGDLGWIRRGQMLEKFESALFALQPGQVSEPVETEFGWHLIKLEELHVANVKPFEDPQVQGELTRLYRQRDAQRRYQELTEKLEQLAFESPATLEPAAKALQAPVKTSDWLTRGEGTGLFANAAVREAAFSTDVLTNGENSKPLPAGENRVVVLRKHAYEAPRQKALDEVREDIRTELRAEAAHKQAELDAGDALKALEGGRGAAEVARGAGAELKTPGPTLRSASGIDRRILEALFRLPRPEPGKARWAVVPLAGGNSAVVGLLKVSEGDYTAAAEPDRKSVSARLRDAASGAEFTAYRTDLQHHAKVEHLADATATAPDAPPAPDDEP